MTNQIPDVAQSEKVSKDALAVATYIEELTTPRMIDLLLDRNDREIVIAALKTYAAQPPAAPVETKSAPEDSAPHNSGERLPSSDAATAGADTQCSAATGEPFAWVCELAHGLRTDGQYYDWREWITKVKPRVPDASIRNLLPLYLNEPQPLSVSEEERHAIEHARYQIDQASILYPDCCFDMDLVKDLVRALDRAYPMTRPQSKTGGA